MKRRFHRVDALVRHVGLGAFAVVVVACTATTGADGDTTGGASPSGYVCVFTESSSYQCVDSQGSNPPVDVCSDKYESLEACQADNKGGQSATGEGADRCLYKRTDANFRWVAGPCSAVNGSSSSSGGSSSSGSSGTASDGGSSSSGGSSGIAADSGAKDSGGGSSGIMADAGH